MYSIHEQKNWKEVGQSRWVIVDKCNNFVLGTYSKPIADTCLTALNAPAKKKEPSGTSTISALDFLNFIIGGAK